MAKSSSPPPALTAPAAPIPPPGDERPREYVVVARRYRPQTFEELVGQEHVARALSNAITTNRVGHAYLFTGARGVGKTSAARIFAKALNCQDGPTPTPCNRCDICQSVSSGDDVDVLEIDGASNRRIEEIRQLRQNVNVRPSRERFKIYIIDEVHMLTNEAFNALLKTLEEPPEHVKFIFCTTNPEKIPITILSRCQRFDFAGIRPASIGRRLRQIVDSEGVEAEPEALELLARRAGGSMRDSQSLLEQLLAFAPERITVADVNGMLGTAGEERVHLLVQHLVERNSAAALADLDAAIQQGVDASLFLEQLLGYFRDCMVASVGCSPEVFLFTSSRNSEFVIEAAQRLGLETVLATMQILDHTLSRLHYSTQGRILAELALVRIGGLENLAELSTLISQLQVGGVTAPGGEGQARVSSPAPTTVKKKFAVISPPILENNPGLEQEPPPSPVASAVLLTRENPADLWNRAVSLVQGMAVEHAKQCARAAISAPNRLVISFRPGYTFSKTVCERPEQKAKFEQALAQVTGQRIQLEFGLIEDEAAPKEAVAAAARPISPQQRAAQVAQHPMVRRAMELFKARPVRVEEPPAAKAEET